MWGKSSMGLAYWVKVCEEKNAIANFGVHTADVSHSTKTVGLNFKPEQHSESAFSVFFLWKESKLQHPGGKEAQIQRVVLQLPPLMIEGHWTTVCHTPTNSLAHAHTVRIFLKFSPVVRQYISVNGQTERNSNKLLFRQEHAKASWQIDCTTENVQSIVGRARVNNHIAEQPVHLSHLVSRWGEAKSQEKNFENGWQSQNETSRDRNEVQRNHWNLSNREQNLKEKNQSWNCNGLIRLSRQAVQKCMVTFPFSLTCLGPMVKILKKRKLQECDRSTSG